MILKGSFGGEYKAKFPWDARGHFGGGWTKRDGTKSLFFIEMYTDEPKTYIREEAITLEEAEELAWNRYQRYKNCDHSNGFERRDYRNGLGFCVDCGMTKSNAFEPLELCCICGKPTYYTNDIEGSWYCQEHAHLKPDELKFPMERDLEEDFEKMQNISEEDFNEALKDVLITLAGGLEDEPK